MGLFEAVRGARYFAAMGTSQATFAAEHARKLALAERFNRDIKPPELRERRRELLEAVTRGKRGAARPEQVHRMAEILRTIAEARQRGVPLSHAFKKGN